MPPPQNVPPVDTIILSSIQRYYLAEGIYLSNIKPSIDPYNCHDFLENTGVVSYIIPLALGMQRILNLLILDKG